MTRRICRRLTAADLLQLTALPQRYKQEIGEALPDEQALRRLGQAIETERILFFGCEEQGQLKGICSVTRGFSTFCYDTCGTFEDFYILPEARHRGIARELLSAAENWAGEQGCKEFASDCELENRASLAFHLGAGFREANRIICFVKEL